MSSLSTQKNKKSCQKEVYCGIMEIRGRGKVADSKETKIIKRENIPSNIGGIGIAPKYYVEALETGKTFVENIWKRERVDDNINGEELEEITRQYFRDIMGMYMYPTKANYCSYLGISRKRLDEWASENSNRGRVVQQAFNVMQSIIMQQCMWKNSVGSMFTLKADFDMKENSDTNINLISNSINVENIDDLIRKAGIKR